MVRGTPIWLTIATAEGLEVFRAMKTREKVPPPIIMPTVTIFQRGLGMLRSHGKTAISTTAKRMAA